MQNPSDKNIMNTTYGILWKILNVLDLSLDLDSVPMEKISPEKLKITRNRWLHYMHMLQVAGYIEGIDFDGDLTGEIDFSNISITLDGIQFLIENKTMNKIASKAEEVGLVVAESSITALIDRITGK